MPSHTVSASCYCGLHVFPSLTLPSSLPSPLPKVPCHCTSCRHWSGALWIYGIPLAGDPFTTSPSSTTPTTLPPTIRTYAFTPRSTKHFCARCGSHLFLRHAGAWMVLPGVLDAPGVAVTLRGHEWLGDTRDGGAAMWMKRTTKRDAKINDSEADSPPNLPLWAGEEGESALLPGDFLSTTSTHPHPPGEDEAWTWLRATGAHPDPTDETKFWATCRCAGVRLYLTRPSPTTLLPGNLCACTSCRRASGADVVPWVKAEPGHIFWADGTPVDFPLSTSSSSSPHSQKTSAGASTLTACAKPAGADGSKTTRAFCGGCGASVFWYCEEWAGEEVLEVAGGLLSAAEGARAGRWVEWNKEGVDFLEEAVGGREAVAGVVDKGLREGGKE